jgi:hypothetical protein
VTHSANVPLPLGRRVIATFLGPRVLFEQIRNGHTPWLGPLLISTAVALILVFGIPEAEFVSQMEGAVDRRGRPVEVSSAPADIVRYGRFLLMMSALVFQPIAAFVMAGALAMTFSRILGGQATYRQYLSITTHALLITALGKLLAFPLILWRDDPEARFSLGLLAPIPTLPGAVATALHAVDVFTLWALIVAALGISIVNPGRSWASTGALLVGSYLALVVVVAALPT